MCEQVLARLNVLRGLKEGMSSMPAGRPGFCLVAHGYSSNRGGYLNGMYVSVHEHSIK